MTQYILHVSSYAGIVPWARHFKGRVEGPHPDACCGNRLIFNAPEHRGKTVCENGHEIPEQVRWDVEADWSEDRRKRYRAATRKALREDSRPPDGPAQFDTEREVIDRASVQFLDGMEHVNDPAEEGDELWFGYIDPNGGPIDLDAIDDTDKAWGMMVARKCAE